MIQAISIRAAEAEKYRRVWTEVDAYRVNSPGKELVGAFLAVSGAGPQTKIADMGCGSGKASITFAQLLMAPLLVDATREAVDEDALDLPFLAHCLWDAWPLEPVDWVYCCDVLEHIPTEFTMLVIARCLEAAPRCFFHINFDPDHFGRYIGEPLHLTVKPFQWWRDRLAEVGTLTEARDMLGSGLFVLEAK